MTDLKQKTWQLTAVSEVLGDLVLTVEETLTVGRGKDNDIVIGSKEMSRKHAELSVFNEQLFVKDLGSSNGTSVNEVKIEPNKSKHLKQEDIVTFASFSFQVNAKSQGVNSQTLQDNPDNQNIDINAVSATNDINATNVDNEIGTVNPVILKSQLETNLDTETNHISDVVVDAVAVQESGKGEESLKAKLGADTLETAALRTKELYTNTNLGSEQSPVADIANDVAKQSNSTHEDYSASQAELEAMPTAQTVTEQVADTSNPQVATLRETSPPPVVTSEFINDPEERSVATIQNHEATHPPANQTAKTESSMTKASSKGASSNGASDSDTPANSKSLGLLLWLVLGLVLIGLVLWFMLQR